MNTLEIGTAMYNNLDLIAIPISLSFITSLVIFSFFFNREIAFKYLKLMISTLILFSFTYIQLSNFIIDSQFKMDEKIFHAEVSIKQEIDKRTVMLYKKEILKANKIKISLEKLVFFKKVLSSIMVLTIGFLWLHSLLELQNKYTNKIDTIAFITLYSTVVLLFSNLVNPLYLAPFLLASFIIFLVRYLNNKYKKKLERKKYNFLKLKTKN